jgi:tetrahydromethanopterin S-methyltransferase subunit B|tara:strand:+ start:715 stop:945 length:231 start_codon:yes stop_codon:yes gene_type:complete
MIEVPLWIFILICIATYINFIQYINLAKRLKENIRQDNVNGMIVSKGFDEIANDMDDLSQKVERLEVIHEYNENKK